MDLRIANACAAFSLAVSIAHADEAEDRANFVQLIANNSYEITFADGAFAGAGYDMIVAEGRAADYFLFGEQHATADIAHLATSIWSDIHDTGYSIAAVEIGPWSTEVFEGLQREERFEDFATTDDQLLTFPFVFFAEEAAFTDTVIADSPRETHALWGLDQEFIASGSVLADLLAGYAETPTQTEAVEAFAAAAADNLMHVGMAPAEAFDALAAAFADGPEAARALVDGLYVTNRIYAPFTGRGGSGYLANVERENYMRTNFIRHAETLQPGERVFLKFGGNHLMRFQGRTDIPSMGGFIAEWAFIRGETTVSMFADCLSGEGRDPQTREAGPCSSYFLYEGTVFGNALPDGSVVVDLRPLRRWTSNYDFVDETSRELIFAFDFYVGLHGVEAARFVGEE